MTITERSVASVEILDLEGVLGVGNAVALDDVVRALVAKGRRNIVVNMSGVSHVDSTGIAMLVASYAAVNRVGGHLILAGLIARVRKVLAITHLLAVFDTSESEADALALLSAPPQHAVAEMRRERRGPPLERKSLWRRSHRFADNAGVVNRVRRDRGRELA
jgi:anti-anti-sigma factor